MNSKEFKNIKNGDKLETLGSITNHNMVLPAGSIVTCSSDIMLGPMGPYRIVHIIQEFAVNAIDVRTYNEIRDLE